LFIGVDKKRHSTAVATCRLDVPFLALEITFIKKRGTLSWWTYIQLGCQDMLDYNSTHIFHHLISIEFDIFVLPKFLFSFILNSEQFFLSFGVQFFDFPLLFKFIFWHFPKSFFFVFLKLFVLILVDLPL